MSLKIKGLRSQTSIALHLLALTLLSHCSMENGLNGLGSGSKQGGSKPPGNGEAAPEVFDFVKECGIPQEKIDDPNAVMLEASMTSFPIVVEGSTMGVNFRVITQAKVHITAKADQSVQEIQVIPKDSAATGSGIIGTFAPMIVKGQAGTQAKQNSGTMTILSLPKKDWIKLVDGTNPEFKDLLCAATGTKSVTLNKGGSHATITFTPALVLAVSPFAPIERLRKEIGEGKSFTVTANVQAADGDLKSGTYQGKTTVKETSPTFTYLGTTVTADIAYEIVNTFPNGAHAVGIPKKQVIYIDSVNKQIKAIVIEDDKVDPMLKKAMPPIYLLRDP